MAAVLWRKATQESEELRPSWVSFLRRRHHPHRFYVRSKLVNARATSPGVIQKYAAGQKVRRLTVFEKLNQEPDSVPAMRLLGLHFQDYRQNQRALRGLLVEVAFQVHANLFLDHH